MVKKKSVGKKCIQQQQQLSDQEEFPPIDHSVIREPINLGVKNVRQIIACLEDGTKEVKDLILNECNIIYECRVCRNLFRSLANFLEHKRAFCTEHYCTKMVLFDNSWLERDCEDREKKCEIRPPPPPPRPLSAAAFREDSNDVDIELTPIESNPNAVFQTKVATEEVEIKPEETVETATTKSELEGRKPESVTRNRKRQRLESLVSKLSESQESNRPIAATKSETEAPISRSSFLSMRALCVRYTKTYGFNYKCDYCSAICTYISTAVRHLVKRHEFKRIKAHHRVYSFIKKQIDANKEFSLEEPKTEESTIVEQEETVAEEDLEMSHEECNSNHETNPTTPTEPESAEKIYSENISLNTAILNSSDESINSSKDSNTNTKRYATRHSKRRKCFYNCSSKTCFYSKHWRNPFEKDPHPVDHHQQESCLGGENPDPPISNGHHHQQQQLGSVRRKSSSVHPKHSVDEEFCESKTEPIDEPEILSPSPPPPPEVDEKPRDKVITKLSLKHFRNNHNDSTTNSNSLLASNCDNLKRKFATTKNSKLVNFVFFLVG